MPVQSARQLVTSPPAWDQYIGIGNDAREVHAVVGPNWIGHASKGSDVGRAICEDIPDDEAASAVHLRKADPLSYRVIVLGCGGGRSVDAEVGKYPAVGLDLALETVTVGSAAADDRSHDVSPKKFQDYCNACRHSEPYRSL